jgi:lipid-binding SYLF domain-containing protein|nr:lipid-binding SYLF domain-containing protein [uncultured Dongia sp.]
MTFLRKLTVMTALAFSLLLGQVMPSQALTPQQELIDKSRISFEKLIGSYEFGELPGYLKRAKAVMIFPDIFKAGFVIGGEGGNGVLMVRDPSKGWSQPAFYTLAAGSVGLQVGGQLSETVFTIMSDKALNAVLNDQMKFGGDMSVAAGPIGKGVGANTTTNLEADVYAFSKTSGLFGGVSLNGAGILRKNDWNAAYYGPGVLPQQIVIDRKVSNPNTKDLVNALSPY